MKVRELIKTLKAFPQDSEVFAQNDNYEELSIEVRGYTKPVIVVFPAKEED